MSDDFNSNFQCFILMLRFYIIQIKLLQSCLFASKLSINDFTIFIDNYQYKKYSQHNLKYLFYYNVIIDA